MSNDHRSQKGRHDRLVLIAWVVSCALGAACAPDATVVVSPVFPEDEPGLLSAIGISEFVVTLTPQEGSKAPRVHSLDIGERLQLTDVEPGLWTVSLSGRSNGKERIFGRSLPFRITSGAGAHIPVFLGRSNSFNRVELTPGAVAEKLVGLTGHTSSLVWIREDESRILVAGGHRPKDPGAGSRILLIDPASLTVEELPVPMSCDRFRPLATVLHHPIHGDLVAWTGGEGCDENRLDLFFARDGRLESHELDCEVTNPLAAYAEVEKAGRWPGASSWPHTGRLVFPGHPSCVVTIQRDHLFVTSREGPRSGLLGSSLTPLGNGRLATVSDSGALTLFDASPAQESAVMPTFDLWESGSSDRRLVSTGSGTQLVYLHSTEANGTSWSLVQLSGRSIGAVIDGDPVSTEHLPFRPVSIDVSSSEETMLLLAGGRNRDGSRSRETSLLYVPGFDGIPTWHRLEDEAYGTAHPMLRTARAGHTATPLPNKGTWIIGGGATAAEVFVHGLGPLVSEVSAVEPLVRIRQRKFLRRKPTITSLTVHDPLDQPRSEPSADIFTQEYSSLLRRADASAVLDLWASAGRGVGDGLVERRVPGTQGCLPVRVDFEMPPRGAVFGDLDDISVDGRWTHLPGGGASQRSHQRALTLDLSSVYEATRKSAMLGSHGNNPPPPRSRLTPAAGGTHKGFENTNDGMVLGSGNQCTWRQFVRVGFDGLNRSETDRTYAGVHVLVWLARGDDCSQGVIEKDIDYPQTDQGSMCVDSIYDEYFGLPPRSESEKDQLHEMVRDISLDPKDFVVVLVKLPEFPQTPESEANLESLVEFSANNMLEAAPWSAPTAGSLESTRDVVHRVRHPQSFRRLYDTAQYLEEMRVRVVEGFVDDLGSRDAAEASTAEIINQVESQLRNLDPLQSCIPTSVLQDDPPSILFAEHLGPDGLYLPLHVVSDLSDDMAKNISELESTYTEDIRRSCQIQSLEVVDDPELEIPRYHVRRLDGEPTGKWHIATDSDRNGGCESGFLVRLSNEIAEQNSIKRVLRCEL